MIITDSWLTEWLTHGVPVDELTKRLTSAGIEALCEPTMNGVYNPLVGTRIAVELTSNRGDCLSIRGLSREAAVITQQKHKVPKISAVEPTCTDFLPIEVSMPDECPRYLGRIIRGLDNSAKTPELIRDRLLACGLTCTFPVVDVLNYVMLELGQPMHAFDLGILSGEIRVRKARPAEKLLLLNGKTVELKSETLVIADKEKALALGGVIGGYDSGVSLNTTDIFIESAFFQPKAIFGTAESYGLSTDASYRFERGVDPELPRIALERATELLVSMAGGKIGPIGEVSNKALLPKYHEITLLRNRILELLGLETPLKDTFVVETLTALGFELKTKEGGWQVAAPSFRFDIECEEDLIEELGRIYGLDKIPAKPLIHTIERPPKRDNKKNLAKIRERLVSRGYQEVITYSFIDPLLSKNFYPQVAPIALQNPISTEMAVMRPGLWPGLIQVAQYNQHRQIKRARLFEIGLRFYYTDVEQEKVVQEPVIAGLLFGTLFPEQWGVPATAVDFFDLKNDLCALMSLTRFADEFVFLKEEQSSALHRGQAASIHFRGRPVGYMGQLHPELMERLEFTGSLLLFELELGVLLQSLNPKILSLPKYPFIRRDLAIILDRKQDAGAVVRFCKKEAGKLLREIIVFDLYEGKSLPPHKKSLGLGFVLQDRDRTLLDKDVDEVMENIVAKLKERFNASLRSS